MLPQISDDLNFGRFVLLTSAVANKSKDSNTLEFIPSVAVAGSILLRERCMFLNATQIMMSLILKFSANQVCPIIAIVIAVIRTTTNQPTPARTLHLPP
jgi:hypothetical protein